MIRRWPVALGAAALFAVATSTAGAQVPETRQVPETHTVKPGDTLWDLAKQYLGDPFLWPEIYRLNTLVVEDPHWIYPGEVLRLAASEKATAVPQAEAPPAEAPAPVAADTLHPAPGEARPGLAEVPEQQAAPSEQAAPEAEAAEGEHLFPPARGQVRVAITAGATSPPPALHRSDFYSSGFLTENEPMPFGRVHGPITPSQIPTNEPRTTTTLYTKIAVDPPSGGTYQVGDSLLLASVRARLEGYGQVVEPRGLGRVVQISDGTPIAEVIAVYGEILPDQATLPAEKFNDPGVVEPVPVTDGIAASVIGWPGRRELKGSGVVLFLDKGKSDGVAPGDMFEVRRIPGRHRDGSVTTAEVMATLQVVHVRDHSATTRVVGVASPDIPRGSRAVQVSKLPS